jgi:hypothetical protein
MTSRAWRSPVVERLYRTRADEPRKLRQLGLANQAVLQGAAALVGSDKLVGRNITVSHTHRFVWYRVAKVATRSIYNTLNESGLELELKHASNIRYRPGTFDGYFRFAFTRHPIDRFESCWRDKICEKNHFDLDEQTRRALQDDIDKFVEFVESIDLDRGDRHLRRQTALIDTSAVDFIGRYERLGADFAVVAERLGRPDLELSWRNKSPVPLHDRSVSPAARQRLIELYADDFEQFGYS